MEYGYSNMAPFFARSLDNDNVFPSMFSVNQTLREKQVVKEVESDPYPNDGKIATCSVGICYHGEGDGFLYFNVHVFYIKDDKSWVLDTHGLIKQTPEIMNDAVDYHGKPITIIDTNKLLTKLDAFKERPELLKFILEGRKND